MQKITIFLILFMLGQIMYLRAQTLNSMDAFKAGKNMNVAWDYLNKTKKTYNPEKAFQIFIEYAKEGDPKAMNAVGNMYAQGLGTDQNSR